MNHYIYSYVYCHHNSQYLHHNKSGQGVYIGWGRIKFFECNAIDIIVADKLLAEACELKKIDWSKEPFTSVVCEIKKGEQQ